MRFLMASGFGPYTPSFNALEGTLLGPRRDGALHSRYTRVLGEPIDLASLTLARSGRSLLRPYSGSMPHLSTETVRSVLEAAGVECEIFDLEDLWRGAGEHFDGDGFDVVGLSTSFICDAATLGRAIDRLTELFPGKPLVLGGHYSNIKFAEILGKHPAVTAIVRGDAETSLPSLLRALDGRGDLGDVPNLVCRDRDGRIRTTPQALIDLDDVPAPVFHGHHPVIPYESMRGCPFLCKYCSYPSASPRWRFRSAERIYRDWQRYVEENGASSIRALDSSFASPRGRFRRLLGLLPKLGVKWEAFTRANAIDSAEVVEGLEAAGCESLLVGFESMSDRTLGFMDKRVSAAENERAFDLLAGSSVALRASFIVGFPGDTPEAYEETHRFIVERFSGRFGVHPFVFVDETMPVWKDAARHGLEVTDPVTWKHVGMDSATAGELRRRTLTEARWKNEEAVLSPIWQIGYERPLAPELDDRANLRIEKQIERLAFLVKDFGESPEAERRGRAAIAELARLGVTQSAAPTSTSAIAPTE